MRGTVGSKVNSITAGEGEGESERERETEIDRVAIHRAEKHNLSISYPKQGTFRGVVSAYTDKG